MIVVLGPAALAEALVATAPGELVVGARDDDRLAQGVIEAAEVASALPLPTRACVVPAWTDPVLACDAVRAAGGSLTGALLYVVGNAPAGVEPEVWNAQIGDAGAVLVRDMEDLRAALEGRQLARRAAGPTDAQPAPGPDAFAPPPPPRPSGAERRAMRPGAPEAAAWRAALRAAPTGRLAKVLRRRRLADAAVPEAQLDVTIRRPLLPGCHSIAVISPKGGVGKTTLTYLLGSVLAKMRHERVLVVDTNPDFGTLADLAPAIVPATLSDLLDDLDSVGSYDELSAYTTTTDTGMHILAAPQDPFEMMRLGRDGYQAVSEVLHKHYDVVIYDCGTGFLDEITQFALGRVDQVVLITTPSLVTTKIIVGAVDHLGATGFPPTRTTLALNMVRRDDLLDRARLRMAMTGRTGGSVEVPFDDKVQRAMDMGEFHYGALAAVTRLAMKRLAAEVVGRMPGPQAVTAPAQRVRQQAHVPAPYAGPAAPAPAGPRPGAPAVATELVLPLPDGPTPPVSVQPPFAFTAPPEQPAAPTSHAPIRRGRRLAFDWNPRDPDAE